MCTILIRMFVVISVESREIGAVIIFEAITYKADKNEDIREDKSSRD